MLQSAPEVEWREGCLKGGGEVLATFLREGFRAYEIIDTMLE
jgi:hypothetical protein